MRRSCARARCPTASSPIGRRAGPRCSWRVTARDRPTPSRRPTRSRRCASRSFDAIAGRDRGRRARTTGRPSRRRAARSRAARCATSGSASATPAAGPAGATRLRVEAGLLDADDWVARAVTLPDDPGADRQAPAPLLRRGVRRCRGAVDPGAAARDGARAPPGDDQRTSRSRRTCSRRAGRRTATGSSPTRTT